MYLHNAKKSGRRVEISKEFFEQIVSQDCHYCGFHPQEYKIGVDRIDSNGHYTQDNVVGSCGPCNLMKRDTSQELFISKANIICQLWSSQLMGSDQ